MRGDDVQLSLYSDYSCRVLIHLAVSPSGRASIDEIASSFKISANHLVKVVHNLAKLGLIKTTRGRGGGMRLAKEPSTIRIGEVIRRTEPTLDLVTCFDGTNSTCPIAPLCGLKGALFEAREAFFKVLDAYTLKDVCRSTSGFRALLGMDAMEML